MSDSFDGLAGLLGTVLVAGVALKVVDSVFNKEDPWAQPKRKKKTVRKVGSYQDWKPKSIYEMMGK